MNLVAIICAGVFSGFLTPLLSYLPYLQAVNLLPFGWMWISGALAVALYRWLLEEGRSMTGSEGAIIGIFTGVVAAFASLLLSILLGNHEATAATITMIVPFIKKIEAVLGSTHLHQGSFLLLFVFNLFFYPILGAIGGIIGVALYGKSRVRDVL